MTSSELPDRDELLLEAGRACVERAAGQLRAALNAYERAAADPECIDHLTAVIEDVEALSERDA